MLARCNGVACDGRFERLAFLGAGFGGRSGGGGVKVKGGREKRVVRIESCYPLLSRRIWIAS